MATIATLLSGGECVGVGAREAGLTHIWGYEIENDIAQVARDNGFNVITADVMELDPTVLEVPDVLHASPVCKRASGANQSAELNEDGTKEAPEDIEMGGKIAQFIDVMTPKIVTIENVFAYRNFKAFKLICAALNRNGYMWDFDNLNAADYGVPQTRRRLILRAKRGSLLPNLPQPERWVGWYEAIEDLIPTLPVSQFAKWQLDRLPFEVKETAMLNRNQSERDDYLGLAPEPAYTICADGSNGRTRAFIADQINHRGNDGKSTIRDECEPVWSIPVYSLKHPSPRAWLSQGRVISMTPRALARFQSIPDSYILPENKSLACKVIGNGVCPLLYQKIISPLVAGI